MMDRAAMTSVSEGVDIRPLSLDAAKAEQIPAKRRFGVRWHQDGRWPADLPPVAGRRVWPASGL